MKTPSIKALRIAFTDCDPDLIKALLIDSVAVEKYITEYDLLRGFFNPPDSRYARMLALNHALGMFGVEHAGQFGERGFSYLNTGDAYGTTLIQFDDKDSIFISSWGDVVERGKYK